MSADMLLNLCYNIYFHVYLVFFIQGSVKAQLERKCEVGNMEEIIDTLDLRNVMDRNIEDLSGGELQRFAIAMVCIQNADV